MSGLFLLLQTRGSFCLGMILGGQPGWKSSWPRWLELRESAPGWEHDIASNNHSSLDIVSLFDLSIHRLSLFLFY